MKIVQVIVYFSTVILFLIKTKHIINLITKNKYYSRRKIRPLTIPGGEISAQQKFQAVKITRRKFPRGEIYMRQKIQQSKFFTRQNFQTSKFPHGDIMDGEIT